MKKKRIFITIFVVLIVVFLFCEAGRTKKKEISCANLKNEYKEYPLNFDKIAKYSVSCSTVSKGMNGNIQRLEFTVDGIRVKISKEKQYIKLRRKPSEDENIVKTQFSHGDKFIRILYTSNPSSEEQTDIYATFLFNYKGFNIKGSIRGIYQQDQKMNVKDVPEEIFAQTENRILNFVENYFL